MATSLASLKQKYSYGQIPEWELIEAGLKPAVKDEEKRKPGRPKKVVDGDSNADR